MKSKESMAVFSTRGQLVIPRHMRKEFGISEGTRVAVSVEDEAIVLRPVTARYIRGSFGLLKGKELLNKPAAGAQPEQPS